MRAMLLAMLFWHRSVCMRACMACRGLVNAPPVDNRFPSATFL